MNIDAYGASASSRLFMGAHLARSVRGIPCAPPRSR